MERFRRQRLLALPTLLLAAVLLRVVLRLVGGTRRVEQGAIDSDYTLDDDLTLLGTIASNATVPAGRALYLNGIVAGDLSVEQGGVAEVRGLVGGRIIARGRVTVWESRMAAWSSTLAPPWSFIQGPSRR